MLDAIRRAGLRPFVTANHFTLPTWLHDPIATRDALAGRDPDADLPAFRRPAGWLDARSVAEFRKYAAYLAWKLGGRVTHWTPLNEPVVVAVAGYVNVPGVAAQNFPPGALSFTAALTAIRHMAQANAAAYDVIHRLDRRSRVGLVHNMIAFTPADPASPLDRRGAEHADAVFNRMWLDLAAGKADFVGVNYYFRGRVKGLPLPVSRRVPEFDFVPATSYRSPSTPLAAPCPTTCSDFGSELYPEGLAGVLRTAGAYGKPLYITENGIADADDDLRPRYLVAQLAVLRRAMAAGARVHGWFHWSLADNFEWAHGYTPRFGLYRYDPRTLRRSARPSAAVVRRIMRANRIPAALLARYGA
jgi:beta-glucosidase/6-phospho-beta-glucosidase/beta-galactosidase